MHCDHDMNHLTHLYVCDYFYGGDIINCLNIMYANVKYIT